MSPYEKGPHRERTRSPERTRRSANIPDPVKTDGINMTTKRKVSHIGKALAWVKSNLNLCKPLKPGLLNTEIHLKQHCELNHHAVKKVNTPKVVRDPLNTDLESLIPEGIHIARIDRPGRKRHWDTRHHHSGTTKSVFPISMRRKFHNTSPRRDIKNFQVQGMGPDAAKVNQQVLPGQLSSHLKTGRKIF